MVAEEVSQFPLEEEYKKNTGISQKDIASLRQWLKTQPHLPEQYITDLDLIIAYYSCNNSTGVTKQVVDLHYTLKTLFNFLKDRRVESVMTACKTVLMTPLPTRTKEGYAIFYTHFMNTDPKVFVFCDAVKSSLMILDLWQYEEGTWPGFQLVLDFEGMTLGHLAKIDIQTLQQFLYYLQEALLVRLKGLQFINAPSFIDKLLMMMRPFMKKELMDIIGIHTVGSESIKNHIPVEALPKDCGGQYKTAAECLEDVIAKLRTNVTFFQNHDKKCVTESLRPGKPKTITDIFGGIEGSFKKLDID